jgi:broad specificity phosphatase PhoE
MTRLFLCRHAEVEEQYHRVFGGRIDMGLSALGHTQAEALAMWLATRGIQTVYASPMQRVQLTLAPFLQRFAGTPTLLPGLREVDFGDWTGCGWNEIEQKFGMSAYNWLELMETDAIPGGERVSEFRDRVTRSLAHIVANSEDQTVAVFAHGGVIRMALAVLLNLPLSKFEHIEVDYASATWVDIGEIKAGRARTEIQLLNFTAWRDLI